MRLSWRKGRKPATSATYVVDVGSAQTKVAYMGRLVRSAPSLVALEKESHQVLAYGQEAAALKQANQPTIVVHSLLQQRQVYSSQSLTHYVRWLTGNLQWLDQTSLATLARGRYLLPVGTSKQTQQQIKKVLVAVRNSIETQDASLALAKLAHAHSFQSALVVDVGDSNCCAALVSGGEVLQTFYQPWGMVRLKTIINRVLQERRIATTVEEIDRICQQLADARAHPPTVGKKLIVTAKANDQVQPLNVTVQGAWFVSPVNQLTVDLLQVMTGWFGQAQRLAQQSNSAPLEALLLVGGGARFNGLSVALESAVGQPVVVPSRPESAVAEVLST